MPLTPEQEANAINQIKADDSPGNPAFESLVREHERRLRGFVRMRTRCDSDVDEILNDIWLKFWRFLPKLDLNRLRREKAGLAPFLYTVALTAMVDYYRKSDRQLGKMVVFLEEIQSRSTRCSLNEADIPRSSTILADASPSPEDICADWEQKESILRIALGATGRPPHEVIIFGLIVCLGWKPQELAYGNMSGSSIGDIELELEKGMASTALLPSKTLDNIFGPLRKSMRLTAASVADYLTLPAAPTVSQTLLSDYFSHPDDPCEDIRTWRYNVLRRTVLLTRGC